MTREELKAHCKKQVEMCEMWAKAKGEQPCGRIYEEHKLILELLEQEPIRTQKAFEQGKHDGYLHAKADLTWIPCNKGLPKKSGKYWCTFGGTNLTGEDYYTTESDAKEIFEDPEEWIGWQSHNVIAWMSLPESYKAESEGE